MDRVGQVELRDGRRAVVGVRVPVIAVPRLVRAPVSAAVMGDAAVAAGDETHHLVFPGVGAQWPTMAAHHGLAAAPVLVVNLRAVCRRDRAHGSVSCMGSWRKATAPPWPRLPDHRPCGGGSQTSVADPAVTARCPCAC
jgi:hypothetical protein